MSKIIIPFFVLIGLFSIGKGAFTSSSAIDLFTVKDISVDVTADCAKNAQEKAMAEGRIKAFKVLLNQLLSQEEIQQIGEILPTQVDNFIRDYEVIKEKYSPVRYVAHLTFRFDEAAVKRFLETKRIAVTATPKNPLVVIPLLITRGQPKLWHDNPWLQAWAAQSSINHVIPLMIPLGDLADLNDLNAEQAFQLDHEPLDAIALRYGAGGTLVVIARDHEEHLEVEVNLVPLAGDIRKLSLDPLIASQSTPETYNQAITQVLIKLDALNKDKSNPGVLTQEQHLSVKALFNSPQDWIVLQRQLAEIPTLHHIQLKTLSRNYALMDLSFLGSIPMLQSALGVRGFHLTKDQGNSWTINPKTKISLNF
ncbi:MAG: DUF2066 domain-containing protein [Alphaproteobacteria bacterium]|nr:DUF2066 domain-containing protein [Alphaproteobacteria bacterium]